MKKNNLIIFLLCLFFFGCKQSTEKFYLVNVLEEDFFKDAHIPGSINIPFMKLKNSVKDWPKDSEIIIYCSNKMCTASGEGVKQLNLLGFANVKAYELGIADWYKKELPINGKAEKDYLRYKDDSEDTENEQSESQNKIISTIALEDLLKTKKLLK